MKGVMTPGVSAGSNHAGASETCTANVTCPSGAATPTAGAPATSRRAANRIDRWCTFTLPGSPRTAIPLELQVLVRGHERVPGDRGHLGHARPHASERGLLHDRREHRALVHELLDLVEQPLATFSIHLGG